MVELIKNKYKHLKCINISLEYLPIFEQFHLFNKAKLVIAQHGAALANIIFMKKKTQLIEIINKVLLDQGENWFKPISKISKIKHYQYITVNKDVKKFMDKDSVLLNLIDFEKFIDNNVIL
jgi:capsular polysaccharide biosynthesis protein